MKYVLVLTTAMALCATSAFAHDHKKGDKDMMEMKNQYFFKKMDTNSDGFISMDESEAFGEKCFTESDTNGDGKISMDEMKAHKMKEHDEMKKELGMDKAPAKRKL